MNIHLKCNPVMLMFLLLFSAGFIPAQKKNEAKMQVVLGIPMISMVDFAGTERKTSYASGRGAEQIITPSTQNKTWLNYSSIVEHNTTNVISVCLASAGLPAGVAVKLTTGPAMGDVIGKTGVPVGPIYLSPYPQDIIVEIGSCFTGRGVQKGHQLTYTWEWRLPKEEMPDDFENIEIAVIYTITTNK